MIISVIPARGGGRGLSNKILQPLCKKRVIDYSIQASVLSKIDRTFISTECPHIKEHVDVYWGHNAEIHHRPEYLSGDHANIEDTLFHLLNQNMCDVLVVIQATSPMTTYEHLNFAIDTFISNMDVYDSAMSVYSMEKQDMLFWNCSGNFMKPVNYNPNQRGRRQERCTKHYIETGAFYITTRSQFMETHCRVGAKILPIEMPFWESFEVDDLDDLKQIEKLMEIRE